MVHIVCTHQFDSIQFVFRTGFQFLLLSFIVFLKVVLEKSVWQTSSHMWRTEQQLSSLQNQQCREVHPGTNSPGGKSTTKVEWSSFSVTLRLLRIGFNSYRTRNIMERRRECVKLIFRKLWEVMLFLLHLI